MKLIYILFNILLFVASQCFIVQESYSNDVHNKVYVYTYKDEDGIFRTIKTNENLINHTEKGHVTYSGRTKVGSRISKKLNDRRWHNKETELIKHGNTFLIPVTIGNKGRTVTLNLIVDTGCGTTLIHYEKIRELQPRLLHDVKSVIADGRVVTGKATKVSFFQVGPIKETSFLINTRYVSGQHSYDGLLGMNFLQDHPFRIDYERNVIVWK